MKLKECFDEGLGLSYVPIERNKVVLESDNVVDGVEKWKHAIVGYVLGRTTPFQAMKRFIEQK